MARPLSALLSQALVAFTIEFDNEFEQRMPHRTSTGPSHHGAGGPWLVSMAMWSNFMRFLEPGGQPLAELDGPARLTNLNGLERWGYIVVAPDPGDSRPKPPRAAWIVRPTRAGRLAQETWQPLAGIVEDRWRARFGPSVVADLRGALAGLVAAFQLELPDYLPVLADGMRIEIPEHGGRPARAGRHDPAPGPGLAALLSKVLIAFALDFERESRLSLAINANPIRVASADPTPLRAFPGLAGVSKEAISASLGFLGRSGLVVIGPDTAGSRGKAVWLTRAGLDAQGAYPWRVKGVEDRWASAAGETAVATLRAALERIVGDPEGGPSPLFEGLEPYPDGWRARVRRPTVLPDFPMVLHRGGFPDGA